MAGGPRLTVSHLLCTMSFTRNLDVQSDRLGGTVRCLHYTLSSCALVTLTVSPFALPPSQTNSKGLSHPRPCRQGGECLCHLSDTAYSVIRSYFCSEPLVIPTTQIYRPAASGVLLCASPRHRRDTTIKPLHSCAIAEVL